MDAAFRGQFQRYIDGAIRDCQALSFHEKADGLWARPDVIQYFERLPVDDITTHLAASLLEILPEDGSGHLLIAGDGTGSLGRYIARCYAELRVTEIDTSETMVIAANRLAVADGLEERFHAEIGDARKLSFANDTFNYVLANGFLRYLSPHERKTASHEMMRVSKGGATIGEGKARNIVYALREALASEAIVSPVLETGVIMFRMSLFYMLLRKYDAHPEFHALVDDARKADVSHIDILHDLAGITPGIFYELRMKKCPAS